MTDVSESSKDDSSASSRYAVSYHTPVLCSTVVETLITDPSGVYVDATLGGGGHSAAMLDALAPDALVLGIDQDDDALAFAVERLASQISRGRFRPIKGNFGSLKELLAKESVSQIDGALFDLGVSSHQFDTAERGFSYMKSGSLDMRMDSSAGVPAVEMINSAQPDELVSVLRTLGEEPRARKIVHAIVQARPLATTGELADIVRKAVPRDQHIKSLSRVFQAFRIAVNDELQMLKNGLADVTELTRPAGRLVIISYHSLEDRLAKRFIRFGNFEGTPDHDFYGNLLAPWRPVFRKPIEAGDEEKSLNPRSRSARLRVGERNDPQGSA